MRIVDLSICATQSVSSIISTHGYIIISFYIYCLYNQIPMRNIFFFKKIHFVIFFYYYKTTHMSVANYMFVFPHVLVVNQYIFLIFKYPIIYIYICMPSCTSLGSSCSFSMMYSASLVLVIPQFANYCGMNTYLRILTIFM